MVDFFLRICSVRKLIFYRKNIFTVGTAGITEFLDVILREPGEKSNFKFLWQGKVTIF